MANVKPIGVDALPYYLQRIRTFLESAKKSLSFPHINHEMKEVLLKIVVETDTMFLHTDQYSDKVKMEAAKLTAALEATANVNLTHDYIDGEHGEKVLTYRKTDEHTFKAPEPLRKPSEAQAMIQDDNSDGLVTPIFKTRCLNATTKFVKDDSQLIMRYPEITRDQAEFLMKMLIQGRDGKCDEVDVGFGYRSMYAPLFESMRLFSLKYKFKIEYEAPMKRVVFEKIPKLNTNNKGNMAVDVPVKPITSSIPAASSSSIPIKLTKAKAPPSKKIVDTSLQKNQSFPIPCKKHKVVKKLRSEMAKVPARFIDVALQKISHFVMHEEEASLVFSKMTMPQLYILQSVERASKIDDAYMLFSSQGQRCLLDVRYAAGKDVGYIVKVINLGKISGEKCLHDVIFEKQAFCQEKIENNKKRETQNTDIDELPLPKSVQERLERFRTVKDDIEKSKGPHFIKNVLTDVYYFLLTDKNAVVFEKMNPAQAFFLKYLHLMSNTKEVYDIFSEECQCLLQDISLTAEGHSLSFISEIEDKERRITIIKKFKKKAKGSLPSRNIRSKNTLTQLYEDCRLMFERKSRTERSRAWSKAVSAARLAGGGAWVAGLGGAKAKLLEGLSQPVQSDKAVKMMQSMGWKGGALGPHGTGITVPITLPLDMARRAGLGHVPPPQPPKEPPKSQKNVSKTNTKDIPKKNYIPPVLPTYTRFGGMPSQLLPNGVSPPESLPSQLLPPGILPLGLPPKCDTKHLDQNYREVVLHGILDLVTSDITTFKFIYCKQKASSKKVHSFIVHAIKSFNNRKTMGITDVPADIERLIIDEFRNCTSLRLGFEKDANGIFFVNKTNVTVNNNSVLKNNNDEAQLNECMDLTVPEQIENSVATGNVQPLNNKIDPKDTPKANHILKKWINTEKTDSQTDNNAQIDNNVNAIKENAEAADNGPQSGCTDEQIDKTVVDNIADEETNKTIDILITEIGKAIITDIINLEINPESHKSSPCNDFQRVESNDNITVEYIMHVETKINKVTDNNSIQEQCSNKPPENVIKIEKLDYNENDSNKNSEIIIKSDPKLIDYENDCQIIIDSLDNSITIDTDEEKYLLNSDEESETGKNDNKASHKLAKIRPSVKQQPEKSINALENDKKNDDFSLVTVKIEKEEPHDCYHGSKRRSFESPVKDHSIKKYKLLADFKKLCILHKDYPQIKIDTEKAREIQVALLHAIDYTQPQLPLLKCQGIQNGGLVYSCQDEKSLGFMENFIKTMYDYRIVYEFDAKERLSHKLGFKINTFMNEKVKTILNRLELFNKNLNTANWSIIKKELYADFIVIVVEVDSDSFSYVCNSNFVLYVGNDCAKFTIIWE